VLIANYFKKRKVYVIMGSKLRGIHTPHRKDTKNSPVIRMDIPSTVTIPMSMHIGKPATPTVKVGDLVKVGTKIGEANGYVSSPIYSSVSGKVSKIGEYLMLSGGTVPSVIIESDGEMAVDESVTPPSVNNKDEFIDAVKNSGIVGLGGAGFPTYVKLNVDPEKIDYLIINGAECEPYVTSDTVTMLTREDDMALALKTMQRCLGIKNVIIGIENNNKKAAVNMQKMAENIKDLSVKVQVLPSVYPQGGEKVLVYHTTGRKIGADKLPIDVGCIVLNCTTVAAIGAYLRTGMPLVEKCVTVEGGCIAKPQNVIAPIGASLKELFDCCGGLTEQPAKLVYGGPMMGITVQNTGYSVVKNTNAVLALTAKEAKLPKTTACIRCGTCVNTCPFGLAPVSIAEAYDKKDANLLSDLAVLSCMECGCCSFVCPANRPLVQINKLSKQFVKDEAKKEANK
jgi:electron transport complex protein RnfC